MAKKNKNRRSSRSDVKSSSSKAQAAAPEVRGEKSEWFRSLLIAVGLALLIRWPVAEPYKIPSGSMEPTLHGDPGFLKGDRIFVNKHHYGVRFPFNGFRIPFTSIDTWYTEKRLWKGAKPERWDIVVFKAAEAGVDKHTLVKRVVGLPGESVHIEDGKIWIDGAVVETPDTMAEIYYTAPPLGAMSLMKYGIRAEDKFSLIPEGHYLVLGDNSGSSRDGRYFGWLPERNILGRVSSIWWPVGRWDDFSGFSKTIWWNSFLGLLAMWTFVRLLLGRSWMIHRGFAGAGMEDGNHLTINRIALGLPLPFTHRRLSAGRALQRGERVLYMVSKDREGGSAIQVGVVAGLPGEKVFLGDSGLKIDNVVQNGPRSLMKIVDEMEAQKGPYGRSSSREYSEVPDDSYYVLLDSARGDSRALGWIARKDILGVVNGVWWPLRSVRRLKAE